jgi:predicted dehydrogenase
MFHAQQSIAALRSGRHVICEVPAVMSIEEAKGLVDAVRQSKKKYLFAENCCYWAFVQTWRQMIREGRLGQVFYMEGEYVHDQPQLMCNPDGSPTWRASFDPIRYVTHETGPLLSMVDDRGVSVTALGSDAFSTPEYQSPNAAVALVKTVGGAVIKLLTSFRNAAEEYHRYCVFGTAGTLETKTTEEVTYADLRDIPHVKGRVRIPLGITEPGLSTEKTQSHGSADWRLLNTFVDAIAKDEPAPIDVYRALDYTLPGVCAAESVYHGGRAVEIPDPRRF